MFAILVPVSLSPLIVTLYWAENKAKNLGLVKKTSSDDQKSLLATVWYFIEQLDAIGLLFLGAAVSLILLPLTLTQTAKGGWSNRTCLSLSSSSRKS